MPAEWRVPGIAFGSIAPCDIAKLPRNVGCQPNLVGVPPFVPPLRSFAQHIRAPVVEENLQNAPATTGN